MAGQISLDLEAVQNLASRLVRAHDALQETPALTVENGDRSGTSLAFRQHVTRVTEIHARNREILVAHLAIFSYHLRLAAADFGALEEEVRAGLFRLESEAAAMGDATPGGGTSDSGGAAPGGSGVGISPETTGGSW